MATRSVSRQELDRPLLPYEGARERILSELPPLPAVDVPLAEAAGLVSADKVVAERDVPGFDNSAMDGYAVRVSDLRGACRERPVALPLGKAVAAGARPPGPLPAGGAVKVMTGAPLPPGTDAVVPREDTEERDGEVVVRAQPDPGQHVRPRGCDMAAGANLISTDEVLSPSHIAVLASLGRGTARVRPRPRVAVLSTGEELTGPEQPLASGQLYDANGPMLAALSQSAGAVVTAVERLGDDPADIASWLADASTSVDVVVTSGGVSVGEHDWVRPVLARQGELIVWGVAIKPGKPLAFGRMAGVPVFAVPGNPGSAFVCAHAFIGPALRSLGGRDPAPRAVTARLATDVDGSGNRTMFCRVKLRDGWAVPLAAQSSGVISSLLMTDGLAVVPPGGLPRHAPVDVELVA